MAKAARSAEGTTKGNTIVLNRVKVIFQVYPGTAGTDAERAIAAVDYKVKVGKAKATGKTAADGGVDLDIPTGSTAELEVFETTYKVKVTKTMEAETTVEGAKRRLAALGYEHGAINTTIDEKVDRATLNFQADNDLNADGAFIAATNNKLKAVFGE